MNSSKLRLNEVTLNVVDEGEGRPVLFLHGFPDSSRLWRHQISELMNKDFRMIAPDLRGFGLSDRPEQRRSYSLKKVLHDLVELLDQLELSEVDVVGHDWGALTGWALAGLFPGRVRRLIAVSAGHPRSFTRPLPSQIARSWYALLFGIPWVAEKAFKARDWRMFHRTFGKSPDAEQYLRDLARPGALTAGLNWYRANHLLTLYKYPTVRGPVMGVWGTTDWALGESQILASQRYVDGEWRYERVDAGHWVPLERSALLNALILDFLGGNAKAR